MENFSMTMVVTNICTLAASFMYFRQKKDKMLIENDGLASIQWRELFERSDLDSKSKDKKIDELFQQIFELQKKNNDLSQLVAERDLKIVELEHKKCLVKKCPSREPITGF